MIDPKKVSPLLTNMSVDREIGRGPNGTVYQVTRRLDGKKMALKHIPIPANDAQTKALIYAGAVKNEAGAQRYYSTLVKGLKEELLAFNGIQNGANLLKFRGYQVDQKLVGTGFDVYLLSDWKQSLPAYLSSRVPTRLQAVNLAIDLCSALEQLRTAGLVHKDIRPSNIFLGENNHFLLGDLGLVKISELPYSALNDEQITEYSAPEVAPEDASLTETMDIYSLGMILYELYNGCVLPTDESGSFTRTAQELPAPQYADEAMSEIILRACAYDPDDRYQTPTDMKQALVLYLQRGNVSSLPLYPPLYEEEPEAEADISAIAATVEAGQAQLAAQGNAGGTESEEAPDTAPADNEAEPAETDQEAVDEPTRVMNPDALSQADVPEVKEEEPEPVEKTPKHTLNDLKDDQLLMAAEEEISVEDFLASLRSNSGLEVVSMDASGETHVVPGYETQESLPEDTEFMDSADNRESLDSFTVQQEPETGTDFDQTAFDAVAYAVGEEMADVPDYVDPLAVPDTPDTYAEPASYEAPAYDATDYAIPAYDAAQIPAEEPVDREVEPEVPSKKEKKSRKKRKKAEPEPEPEENLYDDGYEDDEYYEEESTGGWKAALIAVIVLLVLAGGAFALYTFKTDTVEDMQSQVLSSSSVQITADTKNNSAMQVVCSNASGEVSRIPLTETGSTFTGLDPSSRYSFTLESSEGKFILGNKSVEATTAQMTNLTNFSVASLSAVSADLVLAGNGDQPDEWIVTCTGENGDVVSVSTSDVSVPIEVDGLTPATAYEATIARSDGDQLSGVTTCSFTTMDYTVLTHFDTTSITTDSVNVMWEFSGTTPESWTVTCEGTDGSSTTQEILGTECVLDGLTSGVTYTITLNSASLKETDLNTITVGIPTVTVTSISSTANADGDIEVNWDYEGDTKPKSWSISYYYESQGEVTPTLVTSNSNSVTLTNLVPKARYIITVENADELMVGGTTETQCLSGSAGQFTEFGASDPELSLYALEDRDAGIEEATTTFTKDQHIYFAVQVSYEATDEDKTVRTLYVIRDSDGTPVYVYRNDDPGRTWSGNWTTAKHTGDLPDMPQNAGTYTLEIYFNGGLLAQTDFTVE